MKDSIVNQNGKRTYTGKYSDKVAFPMGGMGAGMISLSGTGALTSVSIQHKPDIYREPLAFAAVTLKGDDQARILEGPVPEWKYFFPFGKDFSGSGNGGAGTSFGLPRYIQSSFTAAFPFASVDLVDADYPIKASIEGWSPFVPRNADDSSLPVAALEYSLCNTTDKTLEGFLTFNMSNFLGNERRPNPDSVAKPFVNLVDDGFALGVHGGGVLPSTLAVTTPADNAMVDIRWFRGGWFDPLSVLWKKICQCDLASRGEYTEGLPSPGGSIYIPFNLSGGEETTIPILLSWYTPETDQRYGQAKCQDDESCNCESSKETYVPWYAERFASIGEVAQYWAENYIRLKKESRLFSDTLFSSTIPPEITEAVAANLSILKSPTVLRQKDGRLWNWEGCCDQAGCCEGSCTHVWNYAQALPHLFPELERGLRRTEFMDSQNDEGHQTFRAALPIREVGHNFHAAADGQLGGIIKIYREWVISGDDAWLRSYWKQVKNSLDYCIGVWDPHRKGWIEEPHHNTYDIEFWGPDGMCTSFYLAALLATSQMAEACGDSGEEYAELYRKGKALMESELFNSEYFYQKVQWENLEADNPVNLPILNDIGYSTEARELLEKEGPKYQYGDGCISDGVLGAWMARLAGLGAVLNEEKEKKHLASIFKYNFRSSLERHSNPQRPTYAMGKEGGLLLCSWPRGNKPTLPFVYSDEVWTGIEYQVASHLMLLGMVREGLTIVKALRNRYAGDIRNPYDEYECGHFYARAMASYGLLQGYGGLWYDARTKTLTIKPNKEGDYSCFISTATGYGQAGIRRGEPFLDVVSGTIDVDKIEKY